MNTSLDFDFAKMLEDSIDDKINQFREECMNIIIPYSIRAY